MGPMMKKRSFTALGEAEMEMLQHVWDIGEATVAEVHERVLATRPVAYTTVMTLMKKLADKGYLTYEKEGNAYRYRPARSPEHVRGRLLKDIIGKVFRGSPTALVHTLVNEETLSRADVAEIRRLMDEWEAKG